MIGCIPHLPIQQSSATLQLPCLRQSIEKPWIWGLPRFCRGVGWGSVGDHGKAASGGALTAARTGAMSHTIPERIVAALEELGEDLAAWCAEGRDRDLAAHERAVLERVRAALPRLLRAVIEDATSGLHPRLARARQACPDCGAKAAPRGAPRPRQVLTRCGTLDLARPYYHCGPCRRGWSVVETTLGLDERARISLGLRAWAARLGAATDFREAAELLAELTGLELGAETVRRHTEALGAAVRAAEDAAVARVERTREPAEALEVSPGALLAEADGAMIRYLDGWHEVKLGLVGGCADGEVVAPSYVAAREPAGAFGRRLAAEAARRGALEVVGWEGGLVGRGLAVLREAVVLGDGARWIWELAAEHFGARVEIVDHCHAAEHLHAAARALFGDGAAAAAWAEARAGDLLARGAAPVLAALRAARAPTAAARATLRTERGYFRNNAERMAYPEFRLDGLPIGSGAIESAADHLVQRRMKRAGMRWSDQGGDALLALRARLRSGRPIVQPKAA
jgi:hypothetical protein